MSGAAEQIAPERLDEDTLEQAVRSTFKLLVSARKDVQEIKGLMRDVDPFRSAWSDTERIISSIIEEAEDK
jgi:hypothetical protein